MVDLHGVLPCSRSDSSHPDLQQKGPRVTVFFFLWMMETFNSDCNMPHHDAVAQAKSAGVRSPYVPSCFHSGKKKYQGIYYYVIYFFMCETGIEMCERTPCGWTQFIWRFVVYSWKCYVECRTAHIKTQLCKYDIIQHDALCYVAWRHVTSQYDAT